MNPKIIKNTFIEKIFLKNIKEDQLLLKKLIYYTYDYFYKFEKLKLNKEKLLKMLLKKFADKNNIYFIIKEKESIIGFVHTYVGKKYIDLCLIYIEKKFRCKGIGQIVINELKKYFKRQFKNRKIKYFRVEINSNNNNSQKFFEKLGAKKKSLVYLLKI